MAEETLVEYNARCKAWGDDPGGYRALWNNPLWPSPPTAPANGAAWAAFIDTNCGFGKPYREWYANDAPQASGSNSPPPPPPTKRKN